MHRNFYVSSCVRLFTGGLYQVDLLDGLGLTFMSKEAFGGMLFELAKFLVLFAEGLC
jgi:hypothetical protein